MGVSRPRRHSGLADNCLHTILLRQQPPLRLAASKAKRHGDRYAGFKATVELAAKVFRLV